MKRITTFIIFLVLCADCLAQTPEQTVRQYVSLLNEWLASPYSADKQKNVLNILNGGESAMKDEIVENFNSDAGKKHTSPGNYLAIFYEKTTANRVKVEIVSLKEGTYDGEKYVIAILKYSGGISLTTAADFWIKGGKITGIVSNEREIARLSSNANQAKTAVTPPVQNNTNATPSIVQQQQLPVLEDGHQYVDLGLPSGTLWATTNVGAANPWDYGDYFAWGETTPKSDYSWSTLKYCEDNTGDKFSKYNTYSYGEIDNQTELEKNDDAATANWGSNWCMPTYDQIEELKDICTWTWTSRNGKNGYEVKGPNGNSIFLPAAGRRKGTELIIDSDHDFCGFWSRTGWSNHPGCLTFYSSYINISSYKGSRREGYSVRPVLYKKRTIVQRTTVSEDGHEYVDLGLPSGTLWATCNVGANNPWDKGDKFAWGETTPKSTYSWDNYKFKYRTYGEYINKYCTTTSSCIKRRFVDNKTELERSDDAATANWGSNWCMPTYKQWKELRDTCIWTHATDHNIQGLKCTGPNGNYIFFPGIFPSGYDSNGGYWTSSLYTDRTWNDYEAHSIWFSTGRNKKPSVSSTERCKALSVRPVRSKN